ncbi:MAG: PTS sugar transporter subunit IIB [Erysipelotrichaceae bacterium]|nr:PTS sugar transporter subunit IIB [Erysipelotrichaceae bacterium]MDD4643126.1 PTS sugar transporter subunit IIB [Erysipelotrichaceae bacterium]
MISLIRCDDRLIHGQCMVRLVQHFKLNQIIVIDDMTATNSILKTIFEKSAMPGMKINVFTHTNFKEALEEALTSKMSVMVVFRFPTTIKTIFEQVPELPKSVMIGPVQMRNGCKEIQLGTYLSAEEIEVVKEHVEQKGIDIYFQVIPEQKRLSWNDVKNKVS